MASITAAGGTHTIIPFAYQSKGQSLRDAVNKYHQRAEGKSLVDYAFHVILSDPAEKTMGQDFPALVSAVNSEAGRRLLQQHGADIEEAGNR